MSRGVCGEATRRNDAEGLIDAVFQDGVGEALVAEVEDEEVEVGP